MLEDVSPFEKRKDKAVESPAQQESTPDTRFSVVQTTKGIRLEATQHRTLSGIQPTRWFDPREGRYPEALAHIIEHLPPHEALEIRYSLGATDGAEPSTTLSVEGRAIGKTKPEVQARSRALADALDTVLPLAYPLARFEQSTGARSAHPVPLPVRHRIRPVHWTLDTSGERSPAHSRSGRPDLVVIPGGREGSSRTSDKQGPARAQPILLDVVSLPRRAGLDGLLQALARIDQRVDLVLHFECRRLSARDLRTLRLALDRAACAPFADDTYLNSEAPETIDADTVLKFLKEWLHKAHGQRFMCEAVSERPLDEAVISMICSAVYGARLAPLDVEAAADCLDLRGCAPNFAPTVNPFASPNALIAIGAPRDLPTAPKGLPAEGIRLGCSTGEREVRLGPRDRARHTYVIGATGTGKSSLLFNLIQQDIADGAGVILVDPHGALFHDVVQSVPRRRAGDVVVVDFADFDNPPGLNLLELRGPNHEVAQNFVCNELIRIFSRVLYRNCPEGFGPIFEMYFRNALLLLMQAGGEEVTLLDLERVFSDDEFRKSLVDTCTSPHIRDFWVGIAEKVSHSECSIKNIAPYILSKITQFTSNALIRPIVGQARTTLNFRSLMDEDRIVLVNLAKGALGELDSQLLGMLLLGKIYLAALSREDTPQCGRRPVNLFVDEFQNVATESLATMLSEARKFGLHLTLANQTISQIDGRGFTNDVAGAVLANAGNLLVFRVGVPDAELLAQWMKPHLTAEMLAQLPDYHLAARLLHGGRPLAPFVFTIDQPDINRPAGVEPTTSKRLRKLLAESAPM